MSLRSAILDTSLNAWTGVQARMVAAEDQGKDAGFGDLVYTHHPSIGGENIKLNVGTLQLGLPGISLDNIDGVFFNPIMKIVWAIYSWGIRILAWFADFALGLDWIEWLRSPFTSINDTLRDIVAELNLFGLFLVVTAFVCAVWIARGKWAQGIMELLVSLGVAYLAVASMGNLNNDQNLDVAPTNWFNPIEAMLGNDDSEDGLVHKSRDTGCDIVGRIQLSMDQDQEGDYSCATPGASIIETFLWYPIQLVNFGRILKDECQDAYALVLRSKELQDADELDSDAEDWVYDQIKNRSGVDEGRGGDGAGLGGAQKALDEDMEYHFEAYEVPGQCQTGHKDEYKDAAGFDGLITQFFLGPSVLLLGIMILVMAFAVVLAGFSALIQCAKFFFAALFAIIRVGRTSLWITLGTAVSALLVLAGTIVFLGTFLVIITDIFQKGGSEWDERIGTFLFVDVLLIVGVVAFWKFRKSILQTKEKVAEALGKLTPGAGGGGGGGGGGGFGGGAAAAMGIGAMADKGLGMFERGRGLNAGVLDHQEHKGRLAGIADPTDFARTMRPNQSARLKRKYDRAKARQSNPALRIAGKLGKGLVGKGALALATGGSSLMAQGGAMLAKGAAKGIGKAGLKAAKSKAGQAIKNKAVQKGKALAAKPKQLARKSATAIKKSRAGNATRRFGAGTRNAGREFGRWGREKFTAGGDAMGQAGRGKATKAANAVAKKVNGKFGTAKVVNRLGDEETNYRDRRATKRDLQSMNDETSRETDRGRIRQIRQDEQDRQDNKARKQQERRDRKQREHDEWSTWHRD